MVPISFFFSFLENIRNPMPITARIGEKEDGFINVRIKLSPWIPVRLKSQDVTVVPILAPIITPTAWDSFIIPELTKPTTITVVADDDWMTAVTPAPNSTALKMLSVIFSRIRSIRPPDAFDRPLPITSIPYRKRARPPIIVKISNTLINFSFTCLHNIHLFINSFPIHSRLYDDYVKAKGISCKINVKFHLHSGVFWTFWALST